MFGEEQGAIELGEPNPRITVVNDNPEFLELMHELLEESSGYDVTTIDGEVVHSDKRS